jgi:septal ring factor EnvC (AmiA/AmiB activator)
MKEKIEKYLKEKRLKLDVEEPEQDLIWEGIRSRLQQKKKGLPEWFWKVAAIFIFVASASYFITNETSKKQIVVVNLSDVSKELGEQENQLKHLANLKWEEVQQQLPEKNTELQFLLDELHELDAIYDTYRHDLNQTINNEPVVRAMLDYYEKKVKILNRLLLEIEKQKYHEETITL